MQSGCDGYRRTCCLVSTGVVHDKQEKKVHNGRVFSGNQRLSLSAGEQADASDPRSPSTFSFHSAFEDPATPYGAPDRQSIEVRCIVFYD